MWDLDFTEPIPLRVGVQLCSCRSCGAAVLIDEKDDQDGRRVHNEWHVGESQRSTGAVREAIEHHNRCSY